MRRALRLVAGALAAAGAPVLAQAAAGGGPPAAGRPPMVVLISVDGLLPDYVLRADAHGLRIPNLRRFLARGSYATGVRGVLPTLTYPSHVTLLTGASPARHGVLSNTTFDPLLMNDGGWYWYASDVRVPTLWDAAARAGLVTASVHWPVSVGARVTHNVPQYWRKGTADDRKLLRALATPGLLDSLERELGPYADGIDESIEGDENRGRFVARLLERARPSFTTAYFTALDHEQHATGPFSPSARAVLERIDAVVGRVADAAERASGGGAVVAVVSDHGFVRTAKNVHLLAAFREAGLVTFADSGAPTAWRAAPWPAGGSAAVMLRDSSDAAARAEAGALLARLAANPESGVARVLGPDAARAMGGFPNAAFVVALAPGYKLAYNAAGPLVTDAPAGGMHGYPPDLPAMRAALFIAGPGVPAGHSLGDVDMRDIAPTLAGFLGVPLPDAEGRRLLPAPAPSGPGREARRAAPAARPRQ